MKILFLGDVVGNSGCEAIKKNLSKILIEKKINFVVINGENSSNSGTGISENITNELISCGVDVITTGNHVWDQKKLLILLKMRKDYLDLIILLAIYQDTDLVYITREMVIKQAY